MSSQEQRRVVVIEDDPDIRHLLKTVLESSGFEPFSASNGADGIELVRQYDPLITTLDVTMPGMDGFATAKRLREFSSTYIIMLTGLGDEIDVVQGLEAGADDYLVKPFRPRELRARIEAVLRRPRDRAGAAGPAAEPSAPQAAAVAPAPPAPEYTPPTYTPPAEPPHHRAEPTRQAPTPAHHRGAPAGPAVPAQVAANIAATSPQAGARADAGSHGALQVRGLVLDPETRIVTVEGRGIDLTRTEFDLLHILLSSGRRVRSKADLVLALRGQDYVTSYFVNEADKRAIEVHMANLRRKIGDSSATPRWIETVRGVGYRIAAD
ncbi:response regulator [Aeromicrobium sp. YIM 150415]|uniref:Response regulator transcription factor n=1 Tax=Aeromicrobium piscarium TaxID=2590901 RepID=A0A554S7J1_9ACTN|nr:MULTISPECIES: response regulator transcription factor [Aeromicrobium]MBM9461957.1 response regulator [Aeromicrobium sp. YIM 150415]TSD62327.1 response regulator transcription factor [Aeromicrobium piscarium]